MAKVSNAYDNMKVWTWDGIEFFEQANFRSRGGFPGFITNLCYPEDELVVVALTNASDSAAGHIAKGVFSVPWIFSLKQLRQTNLRKPRRNIYVARTQPQHFCCKRPRSCWSISRWSGLDACHRDPECMSAKCNSTFGQMASGIEGEEISFMQEHKGDVREVPWQRAQFCYPRKMASK